ncbi:MAG: hypothetical protein R3261_02140 [Alphaproteobacteria bacterium]|nr:hypothetical protein [Alphaproteobacteria bacterium]
MLREVRDYIVYKDNEAYKTQTLPTGRGKDYCDKLNRTYPSSRWSIQRRFYPSATD